VSVKKITIILALIEAAAVLVMKAMSYVQNKRSSRASKAYSVHGKRVVRPSPPRYHSQSPEGEPSAINILAGSSAADEEIHKEE